MNGQFEITVNGQAGAAVTLVPGEYLSGGRVNAGRSGTSTYTLKGGGPETWRLTFSTIGMRYLQVNGASQTATGAVPTITDAKAHVTYTGSNSVGTFKASDERYNKIHDMAQRTLQSNITSIHTDGPNYEKLGWQEVVWTTLPSIAYQQDVHDLYAKITRDIRESQRTSGLCPAISPNYFYKNSDGSHGIYDDSPAWELSQRDRQGLFADVHHSRSRRNGQRERYGDFQERRRDGKRGGRHVRARRRSQPAGLRRVRHRFGHVRVHLERAMMLVVADICRAPAFG
jgi:hypothetical protein